MSEGAITGPGPGNATDPAAAPHGPEILERLSTLPVYGWRYRDEPEGIRHLGPMAQDFMAAFGLGDDDCRIMCVDANGVLTVVWGTSSSCARMARGSSNSGPCGSRLRSASRRTGSLEPATSERYRGMPPATPGR